MKTNFKDIHIGHNIKLLVIEREIETSRICNFLNCQEEDLEQIYESENINSNILLKISKLLKYDFFRLYSQHLILYSPPISYKNDSTIKLHRFRKNIYTKEIIEFILEQINNGDKNINQIFEEYNIPKTTVNRWIKKYKNNDSA